jgi:hypothetical protein
LQKILWRITQANKPAQFTICVKNPKLSFKREVEFNDAAYIIRQAIKHQGALWANSSNHYLKN